VPESTPRLKSVLSTLLQDPTFLPDGGTIGFGLQREYPLPRDEGAKLNMFNSLLRGGDEELMEVARQFRLNASLNLRCDADTRYYGEDDPFNAVLVDFVPTDGDEAGENPYAQGYEILLGAIKIAEDPTDVENPSKFTLNRKVELLIAFGSRQSGTTRFTSFSTWRKEMWPS